MTAIVDPDRVSTPQGEGATTISARTQKGVRVRDPRLDVFRGIAMFIILIAHVPGNWLTLWIPARFGFSDATEIFVFCSGMASALAFGGVYAKKGWWLGTVRVAFRIWQVYWAHIGLFIAIATAMALLVTFEVGTKDYIGSLNLHPFFNNPQSQLPGLLSLSYVPNYFDILPMYLVILALMPVVVGLAKYSQLGAFLFCIALWLAANVSGLNLRAEPWSQRGWFFNPFGWQLIFFTGFAFSIGWLPSPPRDRRLAWLAGTIVVLIVPFAYFRIYNQVPDLQAWRKDWNFLIQKTDFGILRYVHFLAVAYLAWFACGPGGKNLMPGDSGTWAARLWKTLLDVIQKVGQQSLGIFIISMFTARLYGVLFDLVGRSFWSMLTVNALGFSILIISAYFLGWIKSQPWRGGSK